MQHSPPLVLDAAAEAFVARGRRPAAARAKRPAVLAPDVTEEWLALPGEDGQRIRVRVLRPVDAVEPLPVVLYAHTPGVDFDDPDGHRALWEDLALGADAAVVVPEYDDPAQARHPFAAPRFHSVARWVADQGAVWGLDGSRTAVFGISGGARLAAALTLLAAEREEVSFVQQVLVCPAVDAAMDTLSHREFAHGYGLSGADVAAFWHWYADPADHADPAVSPLRAGPELLSGLPPALVLTAEADVLRDEGEAYAARLRAARVPVVSLRCHGTVHAFVLFQALRHSEVAAAARTHALDTLHGALHRHG